MLRQTGQVGRIGTAMVVVGAMMVTGGLFIASAWADDAGTAERSEPRDQQIHHPRGHGDAWERGWRLVRARLMRDIELTDAQWQRVDEAFNDLQRQTRQWHREHREALRALTRRFHAARQANDEQLKALREDARELLEARPGLDELGELLEDVLSDEQWQQFEENRKAVSKMITERLEERARQFHSRDRRTEAEDERDRRRGPREMRRSLMSRPLEGPLFEGIELRDEQRRDIREALEAHREQQRQWREDHRDELGEMRRQMRQAREDEDRERLRELRTRLMELRREQPTAENLHERFRDTLNDEQWEQFQENRRAMREELRQRQQEMREERRQRRDE